MRYAWTWRIKPDQIDEYVRMCRDPWPEIMKEHAAAGIRDYSIYREGDVVHRADENSHVLLTVRIPQALRGRLASRSGVTIKDVG